MSIVAGLNEQGVQQPTGEEVRNSFVAVDPEEVCVKDEIKRENEERQEAQDADLE